MLRSLTFNTGNKVKIAEAGGLKTLVSAMKAHKASVLVQESACAALSNLAGNTGNQVKIAAAGGMQPLCSMLSSEDVHAQVC